MIRIRPKPLKELARMAIVRAATIVGLAETSGAVLTLLWSGGEAWLHANSILFTSLLVVAAIGFGAIRCLQPDQVTFKLSGTALNVRVATGDLFEYAHNIAIPVNDMFDTEVGHLIATKSVHGQLIERMFSSDQARARAAIDQALAGKSSAPVERPAGNKHRYEIGETAVIPVGARNLILVALSATDAQTGKVSTSLANYTAALAALWAQARHCCSLGAIAVPVMGAATSRTDLSKSECIDFILITARRAQRVEAIASTLTIFLRPDDLNEIDLFDIKRRHGNGQ